MNKKNLLSVHLIVRDVFKQMYELIICLSCFVPGMDRILSGCAPVSKTSMSLFPDPSSIELPEGTRNDDY